MMVVRCTQVAVYLSLRPQGESGYEEPLSGKLHLGGR